MLFARRFWSGLADGTITVTFRRWKRPQVVAGRRYRTPAGLVEVDAVDLVRVEAIGRADARRAGYPSAGALAADLRAGAGDTVYRVRFHRVDEPDPRAVLAADDALTAGDVAAIARRLERLDRASPRGPWTAAVLAAIERHPGTRAADLAGTLGWERAPFKAAVRKLKDLGLTHSLEVGYRLSPRGAGYLAATRVG